MRIGEAAGQAGVTAKTVRFWEDQHLLAPPARTAAGYRDYDPAIVERLAFIRHAQAAGLTLEHIRRSSTSATSASRPASTSPA